MNQQENNLIKQFEGKDIKIILNEDGEPLFELYGVGMALGYANKRISKGKEYISPYKSRIDKVVENAEITGLCQGVTTYLTEEMIYDFMFEAKTEKCKDFRKWLSHDVLPSIRKYGIYQDRETKDCDKNYLKYNYKALKDTFLKAPIENLNEEYIQCLKWYKETKYRVPYGNNSNRRSDATHTINDSKIMMMRKVIATLESRSLKLLESNKFGSVYEIDNAIKQIKDDVSKQQNLSNRGKLGQATNKINKLKEQVEFHNPKIGDFVEIPIHGFTVNCMYKDNKRTDSYNRWINNFPNYILKNNFKDIDLNKPTKLWLKFDCLQKFDVDGMIKSIQDQIVRALDFKNDNNIELGSVERNKIVNSYSEGKIYVLIKNI